MEDSSSAADAMMIDASINADPALSGGAAPVTPNVRPPEVPIWRSLTIIGVADVAHSFGWYQTLFGQPRSAPAHDYFGQILDSDGMCSPSRR